MSGAMKMALAETTQQAARHIAYQNLSSDYELFQKCMVAALTWGATPEEAERVADQAVERSDAWWRRKRDAVEAEFNAKPEAVQ